MIRLAVFDWNGTLLADTHIIIQAVNKRLEFFGCPPISLQTYRQYQMSPVMYFYEKIGVPHQVIKEKSEASSKIFHDFYEPRALKARTRSGARALLDELQRQKIPRIVLSNHTVAGINKQLERLKLSDSFGTVLANDSQHGSFVKGKEDRLKDYLAKNQINPNEVVIIGDTVEEIHIGKNLGLATIAITGGYNAAWRLKAEKPDLLVNSLYDIIKEWRTLV